MNLPKAAREELGIGEDGFMADILSEEKGKTDKSAGEEDEDADPAQRLESDRRKHKKRMLVQLFGQGKYHIVPSFFRTMMYLKKMKKEFAVVFRTFGKELDDAVYEFNLFCNGEHPCFNGINSTPLVKFDGSKNSKDYRITHPEQRAHIYRAGEGINETLLVTGPHKRVSTLTDLNMIDTDGDN